MEVTHFKKLEGLYLVVAPIMPSDKLLVAVEKALKGGVDIVQFAPEEKSLETLEIARNLSSLAQHFNAPFLIDGNSLLAKEVKADGVHLDRYDIAPYQIKQMIGERCIVGYTLGNDLKRLEWAETMGADYVSFCSIFPTSSATQCNIVPLKIVRTAKSSTTLPVFAAGGITPKNAHFILESGADGIAVTSAILKAKNPELAARSLKEIILEYRKLAS